MTPAPAHMIKELRIPVASHAPCVIVERDEPSPDHVLQYFVLEVWSDHTIRHPTTGRVVTAEMFALTKAPKVMQDWLRGLI